MLNLLQDPFSGQVFTVYTGDRAFSGESSLGWAVITEEGAAFVSLNDAGSRSLALALLSEGGSPNDPPDSPQLSEMLLHSIAMLEESVVPFLLQFGDVHVGAVHNGSFASPPPFARVELAFPAGCVDPLFN